MIFGMLGERLLVIIFKNGWAQLGAASYERKRKMAAKKLGVRPAKKKKQNAFVGGFSFTSGEDRGGHAREKKGRARVRVCARIHNAKTNTFSHYKVFFHVYKKKNLRVNFKTKHVYVPLPSLANRHQGV